MEKQEIKIVTQEGYDELIKELHFRKTEYTDAISERISVARGFGDLKENSEYDEAKNEEAKNAARIAELEEQLKNIKVISADEINSTRVSVGTVVKVLNRTRNIETTYSLVGFSETDPFSGRISDQSPIGKAINHKSVGDVVTVEAPAGVFELEILDISVPQND